MDVRRVLSMVVLGAFLSSFLPLYECRKLDGYKFPVYTTKSCPRNKEEMEVRSSAFSCKGESSYACLPNEHFTELLEFCYPLEVISIHHDICLYLAKDTSKVNYYDCRHFEHGCPTGPYFGSTIYMYPSCVLIGNGCFLAESSCKSATEASVQGTSTSDTGIRNRGLNHWVWIGPLLGILLIVSGFLLAVHLTRRRKMSVIKRTGDEEKPQEQELTPLLKKDKETDMKESEYEALTIRQWQEVDDFFVSTKAAEDVDNMIKTNNIVIVTGHSGSGKSAIIQHIALQYRKKGWIVKPTYSAKEIYQAYQEKTFKEDGTIFVFNDPIGKESFDEILYNELMHYWESYLSIENVKISFTCRKSILYDQRAIGLFREKLNIVDIDDIKHKLTAEEKKLMFKKYMPDKELSEEDFAQIFEIDMYFPRLCLLYKVKPEQIENKLSFFKEPVKFLKQEIENYKSKDKETYCALVCLILNNNELCLNDLEEKQDLFKKCLQCSELPTYILPRTIINKLKPLEWFIVKRIGEKYSFYHDFEMEVTSYVLGSEHPKLIIKYADVSFLRTRISLQDDKSYYSFNILLNNDHIVDLVDRLFEELLGDRFIEVVLNPCMRNTRVSSCLKKKMEDLDDKGNLELIIKPQKTDAEKQKLKNVKNKSWYSRFDFATSETKLSPLFALIAFGHDDLSIVCLKLLKQRKTDLRKSCLFAAVCSNGNAELIQMFTKEEISESFKEEWDNMYPIHIASVFHNHNMLEFMIKEGMDVDINMFTTDNTHWTSLILASANDNQEISKSDTEESFRRDETVKKLIQGGANVNLCNNDGDSPLWIACQNGHVNTAQLLQEHGADVNLCNNDGVSPLWIACQNGHKSTAQFVLHRGADVNLCNEIGFSPLWIACYEGHESTVQVLLEYSADFNSCNNNGESPLWIACQNRHVNIAQVLLNHGADVNFCNKNGISPLWITCENGHESTAQFLLDNCANVDLCDNDGDSPLWVACQNGHESTAQLLLNRGADVNLCDKNGIGPLWKACENGHESTVKILLKCGAGVNLCNNNGESPIWIACQNRHVNIAQVLLNYGADVNLCNKNGIGPLWITCENDHESTAQFLLDNKANVDLCDNDGISPLWKSCDNGHYNSIKLLLNYDANVNLCNKKGVGPLWMACNKGQGSTTELLLKNGADINLCDNDGFSPLLIACLNNQVSCTQILINHKSNVNLCTKKGASPLYIACQNGLDDTVKVLLNSGAEVNLCDENGESPLFIACENGHETTVQLLLESGADVNLCTNDEFSPLLVACLKDHDSCVQLLLKNDADVNLISKNGIGPLFIACANGHNDTARLLLNHGADVNLCDSDGVGPLWIANQNGHESTAQILVNNGADANLCQMIRTGLSL